MTRNVRAIPWVDMLPDCFQVVPVLDGSSPQRLWDCQNATQGLRVTMNKKKREKIRKVTDQWILWWLLLYLQSFSPVFFHFPHLNLLLSFLVCLLLLLLDCSWFSSSKTRRGSCPSLPSTRSSRDRNAHLYKCDQWPHVRPVGTHFKCKPWPPHLNSLSLNC